MITASNIEPRAGARVLIEQASLRVAQGDRIGLVGRNGAGKTTFTKVLAGEGQPAAGTVTRTGEVGYLPQDPRTGDLEVLARDRILAARGLDVTIRKPARGRGRHGQRRRRRPRQGDDALGAARRRVRVEGRVRRRERGSQHQQQPVAARARARSAAAHPLRRSAPPGRAWPASCSAAPTPCCSTSRPTTSTPTRSPGCATT
nr:ATP-binding cassette domain-containing protein [Angustibacter aerolatus]